MRAFIIRPFGTKDEIDFDRVEAELIQPALRQLGRDDMQVSGSTTGLISKQGNIREDMFRLIAISDLVIADISIHNANVFYELGMRHALTRRHTFMIRSRTNQDHPFDLKTDRYLTYDAADPKASVSRLTDALRSTLASPDIDSPMFKLLPQLVPHGRRQLATVPVDFGEELAQAEAARDYGKLRLLADEVGAFAWDQEALRMIGDTQFGLRAFNGARDTFELLRQTDGDHVHANLRLGTIYQRLALAAPAPRKADLMTRSTQAIRRALDAAPDKRDLVEGNCLSGSNEKSRWIDELMDLPPEKQQACTLRSVHFERMLKTYLLAANLDLNAHYPGINALAGLKIRAECARALPQQWQQLHEDAADAGADLAAIDALIGHLGSTLHLALELDKLMGKRAGEPDRWAAGSRADFLLLTRPERSDRIAQAYREALTGCDWFTVEATRRNLEIYKKLGLFEPGVSAALDEIDAMGAGGKPPPQPAKVVLFTGHMVDTPDKPEAQRRFPRTAQATACARALIREKLEAELANSTGEVLGIAGGACGGDILFHEVCAELGIPTRLCLAFPANLFKVSSVQHGGADWVDRYQALTKRLAPSILQHSRDLPRWLVDKPDYNVWERNNLWMMFSAMSTGTDDLILLALYNPEREPDGPGGTVHLIREAKQRGFKPVEIDARALLSA